MVVQIDAQRTHQRRRSGSGRTISSGNYKGSTSLCCVEHDKLLHGWFDKINVVVRLAHLANYVPGVSLDNPRAHVVVHALLEKNGVGESLGLFRHHCHVQRGELRVRECRGENISGLGKKTPRTISKC